MGETRAADGPSWPPEFAQRYRRAGHWQGETFGQWLRRLAAAHAGRTAVVCGARRWSYRELDERADHLAAGFWALGLRARDRVVVQLPNVAEFFSVCFALFRLGALPVLALPAHRAAEIEAFASLTGAVAYVGSGAGGFDYQSLAEHVQQRVPSLRHVVILGGQKSLESLPAQPLALPEPDPGETAFFQLSGGSTGIPKLIPRTHDDYLYSVRASAALCQLDASSVYLAALPVAHNFTLSSPGALGTLHAGGTVVLAPRPSPEEVFPLIAREGVTLTAVVPPLALLWLEAATSRPADLSSLQLLQVGGAKLAPDVARRVRPTLGCRLQQVFGMAEGLVNYTRLDDGEQEINETQGRPLSPDDEIRVVDDEDRPVAPGEVGHLLTRGPYTIRGYYRADAHNAQAFTSDGFYRTGDLVRVTATGNLVVEGRAKDQINRGGEKVAAEEVENHLLAHPAVRDTAVVSMPDRLLGERTCAFVVACTPAPTPLELNRFLRQRGLAAYKLPDRLELVTALPRTAVGKVDKKALRRSIAERLASDLAPESRCVPPPWKESSP